MFETVLRDQICCDPGYSEMLDRHCIVRKCTKRTGSVEQTKTSHKKNRNEQRRVGLNEAQCTLKAHVTDFVQEDALVVQFTVEWKANCLEQQARVLVARGVCANGDVQSRNHLWGVSDGR